MSKIGNNKEIQNMDESDNDLIPDELLAKINLQIRADNKEAINFYKAVGYNEDEVISYGKRLIED